MAGTTGRGRGAPQYDQGQVADYFAAATQAALVLAAYRAPYRGRATPVNAWWGSFDLAVSLSGLPADPPSDDFIMRNAMDAQEVAVGWWPGDARYDHAAFYRMRTRPRLGSRTCPCPRRPRTGTTRWASTFWTGTISGPPRIRMPWLWSSPVRPSGTPVSSAGGTRSSRPVPTGPRRPSDNADPTPRPGVTRAGRVGCGYGGLWSCLCSTRWWCHQGFRIRVQPPPKWWMTT